MTWISSGAFKLTIVTCIDPIQLIFSFLQKVVLYGSYIDYSNRFLLQYVEFIIKVEPPQG